MTKPKPGTHRGRSKFNGLPVMPIAASVDYRGDNDDELTFVFRGASQELITETFAQLVGTTSGIARGATVTTEHDCIRRNAKGFWRVAVRMSEPDFRFASLDTQRTLIERTLRRLYRACTVTWFPYQQFLNI